MAVSVKVTKDEWCTRSPDPDDQWDSGDYDGRVSAVEAEWYDGDLERPDGIVRFREHTFHADGAMPGELVHVVVADYLSGSTFGTTAGSYEVIEVFRDRNKALELARIAEEFKGEQRSQGILAGWEYSYEDKTYFATWLGYFETLKSVRVWDCYLRPAADSPLPKRAKRSRKTA